MRKKQTENEECSRCGVDYEQEMGCDCHPCSMCGTDWQRSRKGCGRDCHGIHLGSITQIWGPYEPPTLKHLEESYILCDANSEDETERDIAMTWYPCRAWYCPESAAGGLAFVVCTGEDDKKVFKMYSFRCEPFGLKGNL